MGLLKHVSLILLCLSATGCATLSEEECRQASWYEIGLKDGKNGATLRRQADHQKACKEYGIQVNTEQYQAGREQGLKEYCHLENAIDTGLQGNSYQSVCPASIHKQFQRYNQTAYDVYLSREALRKIDDDLSSAEYQLFHEKLTDSQRHRLRSEIRHMDRERDRLRDELYTNERALDRLLRRRQ